MTKKYNRKNIEKLKQKNDLPKLVSDKDFLDAFLMNGEGGLEENQEPLTAPVKQRKNLNKHGLPFLDEYETQINKNIEDPDQDDSDAEDRSKQGFAGLQWEDEFPTLLEDSLKQNLPVRHKPRPMPLKRRLKRYPPPETDLDLHGFTALGAQIKARSFVSNAHTQGYFTLRIIVGKGLHSEDGPVLPHVVEDLLKEMKKENIVLAYEWEGRKKSKLGAVCVYLKRFDD
ncbi:Smr/MutS family protein [uncultured Desulfobacter sp.]|uniref:Smr/MutS family protein n=1 Tax=uncultured Desulfobacter sp. TaxID=240139 RepID=UPI002AAAE628|nr:Smr/MutS family protein [uncultured Desulfobacter sp.]